MKIYHIADRLTRWTMITLAVLMAVLMCAIILLSQDFARVESSSRYMSVMRGTNEFVRRSLSDIFVAANNNVHEIESLIDRPDEMLPAMERIVRQTTRVRSCGISFIADYYPEKGHWFLPYAVQLSEDSIQTLNLGGPERDYLHEAWFLEGIETPEGYWAEPYIDSEDSTTPLIAYMLPIHDAQGQTVAVLGVDMALDWLTEKMQELDEEINDAAWLLRTRKYNAAYSFIIDKDGLYVSHPDQTRVLKENFVAHAQATSNTSDDRLVAEMTQGNESYLQANVDGRSAYVFYSPLKHIDWYMGIVVPKITLYKPGIIISSILLLLIALGLTFTGLAMRYNIKRGTKPLTQLATSAEEVAKGNFNAPLPEIHTQDEIYLLRQSFGHMQQSLSNYVEELKATTAQRAAIENELNIAHNIQMAMLPKIFPPYPERSDIDIYGTLTPARAVGGDLFDFYIRDEKLLFCIGDVSGKGIPAALVMAVTRAMFRTVSAHETEPQRIVTSLNKAMSEGNESNFFVTLFVGVLDLHTGMLSYCNAGHDVPLLVGRDVGKLPGDSNIPIGLMADWEYTCQEVDIDAGTTIFLYTDGLNEAEDKDQKQFSEERMLTVANTLLEKRQYRPEEFIAHMSDAVHAFIGDAEQSDDLTMLAVQYQPY